MSLKVKEHRLEFTHVQVKFPLQSRAYDMYTNFWCLAQAVVIIVSVKILYNEISYTTNLFSGLYSRNIFSTDTDDRLFALEKKL